MSQDEEISRFNQLEKQNQLFELIKPLKEERFELREIIRDLSVESFYTSPKYLDLTITHEDNSLCESIKFKIRYEDQDELLGFLARMVEVRTKQIQKLLASTSSND